MHLWDIRFVSVFIIDAKFTCVYREFLKQFQHLTNLNIFIPSSIDFSKNLICSIWRSDCFEESCVSLISLSLSQTFSPSPSPHHREKTISLTRKRKKS